MHSESTLDFEGPQVWLPIARAARILRRAGLDEGKRWATVAHLGYARKVMAKRCDSERGWTWWFSRDSLDRYIERQRGSHATV